MNLSGDKITALHFHSSPCNYGVATLYENNAVKYTVFHIYILYECCAADLLSTKIHFSLWFVSQNGPVSERGPVSENGSVSEWPCLRVPCQSRVIRCLSVEMILNVTSFSVIRHDGM